MMNFSLRPMGVDDLSQVAEIEREAFPYTWPPTPFKREMQNHLAHYLVTWIPTSQHNGYLTSPQATDFVVRPWGWIPRWLMGIRDLFSLAPKLSTDGGFIAGYIGMWFMSDEAHIVAIGVRSVFQRMGLGELLMQGGVELAMARRMRSMTLEARVSNTPAHALYEKYGFQKVGARKAYYADNREDAVIMTAEDILSPEYQKMFESRLEAYRQRRGDVIRILA
jgi:ribosomal-protein-alanine N-acetyltransferase